MTLLLVPAWMLPTVRTAISVGGTSRATTVCSRTTIIAASTTGSTAACGIEPCAPRPCTVIRMLSAADSIGPAWVPTRPAGKGMTCWASATSTSGTMPARPSSTMPRAPSPVSSAGWNRATRVPRQTVGTAGEQPGGAQQAGHVDVVAAGVHHRDLVAVVVGAGGCTRVGQAGRLPHRQRVHVRPQQHRGTVAVAQHTDHAGAAHPLVHLEPGLLQPLGDRRRGPVLLVGQLRVLMQGAVELLLLDAQVVPGRPAPPTQGMGWPRCSPRNADNR